MDDELRALRDEVARHTGRARALPLAALSVLLLERYWRVGVGSPAARPPLDEAITALDEAHGLLDAGSALQTEVGGRLGYALSMRHGAHLGPEQDRERSIPLLERFESVPGPDSAMRLLCRLQLATMLLRRSMPSPSSLLGSRADGSATADADRAVALLRGIVDGPPLSVDLTATARSLLSVAETVRSLLRALGGGPGGALDLAAVMRIAGDLPNLQQRLATTTRPGPRGMPSPFAFGAADDLARAAPMSRPVTVITPPEGPDTGRSAAEAPPARPATSAATFRARARRILPDDAAVRAVVDDPAALAVDVVDRLVACCCCLVDAPGAAEGDHLLAAVALYVRGTTDPGSRWGDEAYDDPDSGDLPAAGRHLVAAGSALLAAPADTVRSALHLAGLLGVRDGLAAAFRPAVKALTVIGADGLLWPAPGRPELLSASTGRFERPDPARLRGRILVTGTDPAPVSQVVSVVRSAAQVIELAGRGRAPLGGDVVVVADPRGDLPHAGGTAMVLRRSFFPGSAGLGRTVEDVTADASPAEVRARLDASVLHLGCGVTASGDLELAGSAVLTAAEIAGSAGSAGGLAVLSPSPAGTPELADALLAAGFSTVIGFRRDLPGHLAALLHVVLYGHLVDERREPAAAVAAVRDWLADPGRPVPGYLPTWLAPEPGDPELRRPEIHDVLVCYGI